jgi:hypothetical protein
VVDGDQQARRYPAAKVEVRQPQQRPPAEVESTLQGGRCGGDRGAVRRRRQRREIQARKGRFSFRLGQTLRPPRGPAVETRPQRVVVAK